MESKRLQDKVQAFAQRLLEEANGDPVKALGLLVLVLDGSDLASADHVQRLVAEIRKVLLPDNPINREPMKPIRHLAGNVSWEGIQHCLRCGAVIAKNAREGGTAFPPGHVYQIDSHFVAEHDGDFESCL